jgi:hypothetical protein
MCGLVLLLVLLERHADRRVAGRGTATVSLAFVLSLPPSPPSTPIFLALSQTPAMVDSKALVSRAAQK